MKRLLLLALVGCGGGGTTLAPVIDLPPEGSEADPIPSLDEVELSVARDGADTPLVSATFARGESLSLDGVPFGDDLVVRLIGRSAGGEIAFGRTCRFDLAAGVTPPTPHLWFARTVRWADAIAAPHDRTGGAAWTTASGGVAFALGVERDGTPVTAIDVLDVSSATWTTAAQVSPRVGGMVASLGDGRALLIGGTDAGGAPATTFELVDPAAAEAARVTSIDEPRLGLTLAATATESDGDQIVIGGDDGAGPVGEVFSIEPGGGGQLVARLLTTATLAHPREGHTLTRLSDDIGAPFVVIGGRDAAGEIAEAELYRPLRESFSTGFVATMNHPRSGHAAIRMPDGSVLVVGGISAGVPVATMELFTIDGGFVDAGDLPAAAGLIDPVLTPLPDGRVLLSGGRTADGMPTAATYILRLDPLDGSIDVAATDDLGHARAGHATALLCDGTVLAVGGAADPSVERYQPPSIDR